jgi:hypothetical protein
MFTKLEKTMIRTLILALAAMMAGQASAEIVHCRFDGGFMQPSSFADWDTDRAILKTSNIGDPVLRKQCLAMLSGKKPKSLASIQLALGLTADQFCYKYNDVQIYTGLPPFNDQGFSLVVFGDVPALHLEQTYTTYRDQSYPYIAYWGLVPGKLDLNIVDRIFEDPQYGPRGFCYSKSLPTISIEREGGGGHSKGRCDRNHGEKRG